MHPGLALLFVRVQPNIALRNRRLGLIALSSLLLAVAGAWTALFLVATPGWLNRPPRTFNDYRHDLAFAVFNIVGDVGAVCFWVTAATLGYRTVCAVEQRWAKYGVLLVSSGAAVLGLGTFSVALLIDLSHILLPAAPSRFSTLGDVYISALVTGQTIMSIGLAFPTLVDMTFAGQAVIRRHRERRYQRKVLTLWRLMTVTFPFVILPEHSNADTLVKLDGMPGRSMGPQEGSPEQVVNEIVDGLSWLAPYYSAAGLQGHTDKSGDRLNHTPGGVCDARAAALVVHTALVARARDVVSGTNEAVAEAPYPRLVPDLERWDNLVRWLAELSDGLTELGTAEFLDRNASELTR